LWWFDVANIQESLADLKPQETAQLEAQAFELQQKTALAAEAKTVLDSWVRYEGQVKVRQQRELAESIIAKIEKELENPKVLKQILDQSVADVEREFVAFCLVCVSLIQFRRYGCQGIDCVRSNVYQVKIYTNTVHFNFW